MYIFMIIFRFIRDLDDFPMKNLHSVRGCSSHGPEHQPKTFPAVTSHAGFFEVNSGMILAQAPPSWINMGGPSETGKNMGKP